MAGVFAIFSEQKRNGGLVSTKTRPKNKQTSSKELELLPTAPIQRETLTSRNYEKCTATTRVLKSKIKNSKPHLKRLCL
jgi:hypothetical protein